MRENQLRKKLAAGQPIINGWLAIPSSYSAEVMGHQGFDSITVDLQHGMIGMDAALPMFQALSSTPTVPLARVPWNDPAQIMRLLDTGAYGIICPMISTVDDAASFVSSCRYPPRGQRSFGPARALLYGGADYYPGADNEILALGMIETQAGLDNLDQILALEGLDGIYIGPNDLALALGCVPRSESDEKVVIEAIAHIRERANAHGKIAGIFCSSGEAAGRRITEGFQMVTPGNEVALMSAAAKAAIAAARGAAPVTATGNGY